MRVSLPSRRSVAVSAAAAASAGLLTAWVTATPSGQQPSAGVFRNDFVTFRYPASWSARVWTEGALHFQPMVYLSTERVQHDPCQTSTTPSGKTITCGSPIDRLAPGGVLVVWENQGYPGASVARFPGASMRVGGRAARLSVHRPGSCRRVGADETMSVAIARPLADNWTQVDACLRGPKLKLLEQQLRAVLASTRFLNP